MPSAARLTASRSSWADSGCREGSWRACGDRLIPRRERGASRSRGRTGQGRIPMSWYRRTIVVGVVMLLVASVGALPTAAAGNEVHKNAPSQTPLGGGNTSPSGTVSPDASLGVNPFGCYGRSDQPHPSGQKAGRVAAQGWTICDLQQPSQYVYSELIRD